MRFAYLFNLFEIGIWSTLGVACFVLGIIKSGRNRTLFFLASIDLIAFGLSDFAEAKTFNEWWRPWWLLLWKAACLLILLILAAIALKKRRSV